MQGTEGINVLFIAGFGPIVRDTTQSRRSTARSWAFPSKRRVVSTSIRKLLKAQRLLHCGHSLRPHSRALVKIPGLTMCQFHKPGLSLTLTASKRPPQPLNHEDIESLPKARKNLGDKPSVVSSHRKDCSLASPSRRRCERKSSADRVSAYDELAAVRPLNADIMCEGGLA
jgi:hypothetical protein